MIDELLTLVDVKDEFEKNDLHTTTG